MRGIACADLVIYLISCISKCCESTDAICPAQWQLSWWQPHEMYKKPDIECEHEKWENHELNHLHSYLPYTAHWKKTELIEERANVIVIWFYSYFPSSNESNQSTIWFPMSSTTHTYVQLHETPHGCWETSDAVKSHRTSYTHGWGVLSCFPTLSNIQWQWATKYPLPTP